MEWFSICEVVMLCVILPLMILDIYMFFKLKLWKVYSTSCIFISLTCALLIRLSVIIIDLSVKEGFLQKFDRIHTILLNTIPHMF